MFVARLLALATSALMILRPLPASCIGFQEITLPVTHAQRVSLSWPYHEPTPRCCSMHTAMCSLKTAVESQKTYYRYYHCCMLSRDMWAHLDCILVLLNLPALLTQERSTTSFQSDFGQTNQPGRLCPFERIIGSKNMSNAQQRFENMRFSKIYQNFIAFPRWNYLSPRSVNGLTCLPSRYQIFPHLNCHAIFWHRLAACRQQYKVSPTLR